MKPAVRTCLVTAAALLLSGCALREAVRSDPWRLMARCDKGGGAECNNLGVLYAQGEEVEHDERMAAALYGRACILGDPTGCKNLGAAYLVGRGVPEDHHAAGALFERSCRMGDPGGCNNLGGLYFEGKGVSQQPEIAALLYEVACAADSAQGCHNLGVLYVSGVGVEAPDAATAQHYIGRACALGADRGCAQLEALQERDGSGFVE